MENVQGHLVLLMAPSGSGKKMMVDGLGETADELLFIKTYTSRAKREGTDENPKYEFVSLAEFEQMIEDDTFVEWANFSGNLYGTSKLEIAEYLKEKKVAFKEMELQGVNQIKNLFPKENISVIYIDAGDWSQLETRILARAAISDEELELRRLRYEEEAKFKDQADIIISNKNGEGEKAQAEFRKVIKEIVDSLK